jgi:hypothetical protein
VAKPVKIFISLVTSLLVCAVQFFEATFCTTKRVLVGGCGLFDEAWVQKVEDFDSVLDVGLGHVVVSGLNKIFVFFVVGTNE